MNVRDKEKRIISIVICICFLFQIIFRSFVFDSVAAPANPVVALIFRDSNGYHIKDVSNSLNRDGKLTLKKPIDIWNTGDESDIRWTPVLIENSFANVKKVIENGGSIDIADYDISRPPTLATSSVATPSGASGSNARNNGFRLLSDVESRNATITLYKSSIYFSVGSRVNIKALRNIRNPIAANMRQFVSKNGNTNQIFFLAVPSEVQPPVAERELMGSGEVSSRVLSSSPTGNIVTGGGNQSANNQQNTGENGSSQASSQTGVNIPAETSVYISIMDIPNNAQNPNAANNITDIVNPNTNNSRDEDDRIVSNSRSSGTSSANIRGNVSGRTSEGNNALQNQNTVDTTPAQGANTLPNTAENVNTDTSAQPRVLYAPLGSTENTSVSTNNNIVSTNIGGNTANIDTNVGSRRPGVSISRGTSDNKVNGFITTKNTYVSINDDNFDSNNYSVLIYKNVDGKEVLSETKYSWSSNGDSHRADISFEDDGEYRIAVVRNNANSDRAGVRFEEKVKVDSTAPYITITGVEDLTANARTVSPVVKYSDVNIDLQKSKITLTSVTDGKSRDLIYKAKKEDDGYILNLDPIYIDDNYILTVSIYDLAGNVTEQKVNFSVNKNGATFKFKPEDIVGQYTNKSFKPAIEVWNTDEISIVSATINGMDEPYEFVNGELRFLKSIDRDGKYTFNLEVIDTAGNKASMKPVEIIYDATKPVAMILGAEENNSYEGSINIILSTELPGDFIESVWLDERLLTKSEYTLKDDGKVTLNVSVEGNHTIKAQAKDLAGNLSDIVSVSFDIKVPKANLLSAGYIPWAVITLGLLTGLGIAFANYKKGLKREEE